MADNGNTSAATPEASARPRRVLVTGGAGMLGSQVLLAVPDDIEALGTDMREAPGVDVPGVDLTDAEQVDALFAQLAPLDGVIHTAAYTAVDRAEEEPELAAAINGDACGVLARAAAAAGIPMVLVSTDFVFDGDASTPYGEDAATSPQSVYGATKLDGEAQALAAHPGGAKVVRTQWLYGPRGSHFPHTMQRLAKERDRLKVVSDQVGSPTSTLELAPALWDVLISGEPGVWHAACDGACSWYDLAVATIDASEIEGVEVEPCTTDEFPRPATRPAYSVLDCSKLERLRGKPMAAWKDALLTYLGTESS
ncbi:dTDP-4-dehydrorhamnose reductase [Planctomycetota bacterium]|jgi:dTDP-4-dehydrorhamnose reductase|nr:dTDP-4-dehydrorhamnose reductase [Planctomycetota bacterium]MDC0585167.1 dTDP-4-dehydrorhamnose reductase [Planctomycetota bacterium]